MNRFIIRLISILLVPCLMADRGLAMAQAGTRHQNSLFASEALSGRAFWMIHPLAKTLSARPRREAGLNFIEHHQGTIPFDTKALAEITQRLSRLEEDAVLPLEIQGQIWEWAKKNARVFTEIGITVEDIVSFLAMTAPLGQSSAILDVMLLNYIRRGSISIQDVLHRARVTASPKVKLFILEVGRIADIRVEIGSDSGSGGALGLSLRWTRWGVIQRLKKRGWSNKNIVRTLGFVEELIYNSVGISRVAWFLQNQLNVPWAWAVDVGIVLRTAWFLKDHFRLRQTWAEFLRHPLLELADVQSLDPVTDEIISRKPTKDDYLLAGWGVAMGLIYGASVFFFHGWSAAFTGMVVTGLLHGFVYNGWLVPKWHTALGIGGAPPSAATRESEGERLWAHMRARTSDNLLATRSPALVHGGYRLMLDGLTLIWPTGRPQDGSDFLVISDDQLSKYEKEYRQPGAALINFYAPTPEQQEALKAYLLSRPDRFLARFVHPQWGREFAIDPLPISFWIDFFRDMPQDHQDFDNAVHAYVVGQVADVIRSMRENVAKTTFRVLQEGAGNGALLRALQAHVHAEFPDCVFEFLGIDAAAREIGSETSEPGFKIRPGLVEETLMPGEWPVDLIIDDGLLVKGIVQSKVLAFLIIHKWEECLAENGALFSIPFERHSMFSGTWIPDLTIPPTLRILGWSIPEHIFAGRHPKDFIVLRKEVPSKVAISNVLSYAMEQLGVKSGYRLLALHIKDQRWGIEANRHGLRVQFSPGTHFERELSKADIIVLNEIFVHTDSIEEKIVYLAKPGALLIIFSYTGTYPFQRLQALPSALDPDLAPNIRFYRVPANPWAITGVKALHLLDRTTTAA